MINKDNRTRIWLTICNEDFDLLKKEAEGLNLSVPSLVLQLVQEHLHKDDDKQTYTPEKLNCIVKDALKEMSVGETFTVKDLFEEEVWTALNRSEKATAAKILASIKKNNEDCLSVPYKFNNTTSIYHKVKDLD